MQVSMDAIVNQLKKELALAEQHTHQAQKVREHLTAVRALCDLVLQEANEAVQVSVPKPVMVPQNTPQYIQESDANGGSLLDF